MIYLLFLVALLLICCNPDQAKDNSKDETIEYFIPLSHRVEKDAVSYTHLTLPTICSV